MSVALTGGVLLKCALRAPSFAEFQRSVGRLAKDCVPLAESAEAHAALEGDETYLYLFSREAGAIDAGVLSRVVERAGSLPGLGSAGLSAAKLVPVFDVAGASRGEDAPFHYVVETDVAPEHEADLNAWYDTEHMPGLAGCPGSVRARRFRNPGGSPRYHACYELVRTETLGSEPWLAVRHTAWSDRVRPHFRGTKRTMFRRLFEIPF
ncbi:MAG TPA: hypothetical protein VFI80_04850 [Burkholderiales bacterium]|nr:hypothetical protein [Burkholderiales bacterium]